MKKYLIAFVSVAVMNIAVAQSDISTFFQQLKTFKADFSQVVEQDGKTVQQSTGTVWLKKPLKFRWNYQTPEPMQLVSDGQQFYHYDIGLAQVTTKPVSEVTGSALSTLLSDGQQLKDVFTIASLSVADITAKFPFKSMQWLDKASSFYQLTPKNKTIDDGQPNSLIIGLTSENQLSLLFTEDNYGNNTFTFSNVYQGDPIADSQFNFKAPAGVDVLGQ